MTSAAQFDEPFDDAPAVWLPVDIIAERDNAIVGPGLERFDEGVESRRATVDVTDGDCAWFHGETVCSQAAEFFRALAGDVAQLPVETSSDITVSGSPR